MRIIIEIEGAEPGNVTLQPMQHVEQPVPPPELLARAAALGAQNAGFAVVGVAEAGIVDATESAAMFDVDMTAMADATDAGAAAV
ncbi:MAG: hypothetical protein SF123_11470 [Chloroflexota bacterium]|nr:hypothetical protein [Chloroflexota bacterium]